MSCLRCRIDVAFLEYHSIDPELRRELCHALFALGFICNAVACRHVAACVSCANCTAHLRL